MNPFKFSLMLLFCCCVLSILFIGPPCCCMEADKLNIVTTTTNLASIAEAVGGEHVSVTSIGSGDEDPHFIQAKPSFMMKAKKADLWICVGMELEIGYEGLILQGSRNPRIQIDAPVHLDVSEGIIKLEVPTGKIDRSMGDVHPLGNPHYWLDPYNGRIIAANICRRLKQLDPQHTDDYDRNLAAFLLKLDNAMFGEKLVAAVGGHAFGKWNFPEPLIILSKTVMPRFHWVAGLANSNPLSMPKSSFTIAVGRILRTGLILMRSRNLSLSRVSRRDLPIFWK